MAKRKQSRAVWTDISAGQWAAENEATVKAPGFIAHTCMNPDISKAERLDCPACAKWHGKGWLAGSNRLERLVYNGCTYSRSRL
jgi:hypothetical protein